MRPNTDGAVRDAGEALNEQNFARFDAKLEQRIAELRADLRTEIAGLRGDMKGEMQALKAELIKWLFLFWSGTLAALLYR